MMEPWELYNHLSKLKYNTSGFDLDWLIESDDSRKEIRLEFKASDSKEDWIVNIFGFIPVIHFPFMVAYGWNTVFNGCKALIMEELIRLINEHKDYRILICGHSYGGAVSVLAGLELYKLTKVKADIVTFGAPMTLFLFLSRFIARRQLGKVMQWANWSDLVTYCPPLFGFWHINLKRIGKFKFLDLFNPEIHKSYGNKELYI